MGICSFVPMGRCGNFMMEAMATFSYAKKHGFGFSVPIQTTSEYHSPIYLRHLTHPEYNGLTGTLILEQQFEYSEIPFSEQWRGNNITLQGYYQDERYYSEYRNEILEAFGLPWKLKQGKVSVHVRRGDYIELASKHPYYGKDWYERAMALFPDAVFEFYSDDLNWCIENFGEREDCEFYKGDILDDLVAISQCQHHINSSSTFSWVSAWLGRNEDKVIVTPEKWFNDGWCNLNTSFLIPQTWIKLK